MRIAGQVRLVHNADPTHETAEECYDKFGWYYESNEGLQIPMQTVSFDLASHGSYHEIVDELMSAYPELHRDEARGIAKHAKSIADAAQAVEDALESVVAAYRNGDLNGCLEALAETERIEYEAGGDSPATDDLRSQIIHEQDE